MKNPYIYVKQNVPVIVKLIEERKKWTRYGVRFPSLQEVRYLGSSEVIGEYVFPSGVRKAPLVILVHGMGARSVIPCKLLARTLAKNGIASFILYLIFHQFRAPPVVKEKYPNLSAEEWFESYQLSVTDIRQVIDWVDSRQEIDSEKIALAGISFGGFISAITMALDNRVKAGIFIVMGGNSEKITRHSLLLRRQYKYDVDNYLRNQESYLRYLAEVAEKGFENVEAVKNSYLTDPLTFSSALLNRPILMLNALWDEMIPRVAAIDMWKACGKPPISWYPATHASIWLWYPLIRTRISGFLKTVFNGAGPG